MPDLPPGTVTAMCACGHHWNLHYASDTRTGDPAVCRGLHGTATPGPYRPCDCTGWEQWSGPRDARTGEPVRPIQLATGAAGHRGITQRLVLDEGASFVSYGIWTCAGCSAFLAEGLIHHAPGCPEMTP